MRRTTAGIFLRHLADQKIGRLHALRGEDVEHRIGIARQRAVVESEHNFLVGQGADVCGYCMTPTRVSVPGSSVSTRLVPSAVGLPGQSCDHAGAGALATAAMPTVATTAAAKRDPADARQAAHTFFPDPFDTGTASYFILLIAPLNAKLTIDVQPFIVENRDALVRLRLFLAVNLQPLQPLNPAFCKGPA